MHEPLLHFCAHITAEAGMVCSSIHTCCYKPAVCITSTVQLPRVSDTSIGYNVYESSAAVASSTVRCGSLVQHRPVLSTLLLQYSSAHTASARLA
jgi:hypothetical protein